MLLHAESQRAVQIQCFSFCAATSPLKLFTPIHGPGEPGLDFGKGQEIFSKTVRAVVGPTQLVFPTGEPVWPLKPM